MTQRFEPLVRPFQLVERAIPRAYIPPGQQSVQPVRLAFGRAGQGKVINGSQSFNKSFYCDQHVVEKSTDPSGGAE